MRKLCLRVVYSGLMLIWFIMTAFWAILAIATSFTILHTPNTTADMIMSGFLTICAVIFVFYLQFGVKIWRKIAHP